MPAYRFQAADASGKFQRGILDADSARQARALIRERGLTPIEVDALENRQATGSIVIGGRLGDADLAVVTRQLASLLSARLPLERALNAVVEQAGSRALRGGAQRRRRWPDAVAGNGEVPAGFSGHLSRADRRRRAVR